MQATLNLFEHVLGRARRLQGLGRPREAGQLYRRLANFRELPPDVAEETQARLAELHLRRRRYGAARRHLAAALVLRPDGARYHYLMATALQADEGGDLERAAFHLARAVELAPDRVRYRCEAGLLAVRRGDAEGGLALLRQAAGQAPEQPEVVGRLVKGLLLAGRPDEARSAVRAALFRAPRSPRLRKLSHDLEFQLLRRDADQSAEPAGPVVLPFVPRGPVRRVQ
jgi:tetratricopeptide (TPR) repeat protein